MLTLRYLVPLEYVNVIQLAGSIYPASFALPETIRIIYLTFATRVLESLSTGHVYLFC